MLDKRTLLAVVVGMFLVSPSAARGDDLADLQTAYKQYAAALSQQDADATMAFFHDEVVGFWPDGPFPSEGKAAIRHGLELIVFNYESFTTTPMNTQYRVIGNNGIVTGNPIVVFKPKDGPQRTAFLRLLQNWVEVDGQWRLASFQLSYIPSGK